MTIRTTSTIMSIGFLETNTIGYYGIQDCQSANLQHHPNVDIAGNNALQIKAIGVVISTFETLPNQGWASGRA
jgi:hypothetical protein